MRRCFLIEFVAVVMLFAGASVAQEKNQVAVVFGRTFVSHQTVPRTSFLGNSVAFGRGITIEGNYGRLLRGGDRTLLSLEIPVVFDLDEDLNYGVNVIPESYRAYFVTPSARVTLFPNLPTTPWVSLGGGFAHFGASSKLEFGGTNPGKTGKTTGVLQIGAGLDVRIWRSYSLRAEFRDFYSGVPPLNVNTGKNHQHNLFVGAGIVWHLRH